MKAIFLASEDDDDGLSLDLNKEIEFEDPDSFDGDVPSDSEEGPYCQEPLTGTLYIYVSLVVVGKYSKMQLNKVKPTAYYRLWQLLYGPCMILEHSLQPAEISCMLVFVEGEKPEKLEKNPRSREENQH